jgi:hypothetical protein
MPELTLSPRQGSVNSATGTFNSRRFLEKRKDTILFSSHLDSELTREAGRLLFLSLLARALLHFLLEVGFPSHFLFFYSCLENEKRDDTN